MAPSDTYGGVDLALNNAGVMGGVFATGGGWTSYR